MKALINIQKAKKDIIWLCVFGAITSALAFHFSGFEMIYHWSKQYEAWEIDEIFTTLIILSFGFCIFSIRRYQDLKKEISLRIQSEMELEVSSKLEMTRESERAAISQEIHDCLGQVLTYIKLNLSWISKNIQTPSFFPQIPQKLEDLSGLVDNMIDTTREISGKLSPLPVEKLGLINVIKDALEQFKKISSIPFELSTYAEKIPLNHDQSLALYRILQESLNNIVKHSKATKVEVFLSVDPKIVHFEIHDNGKGMDPKLISTTKSLGLPGIRERVRSIQGTLDLTSSPGKGTTLDIRIPIQKT